MPHLARTLTPLGWLTAVGLIVVLIVVVLGGLGFRFDPFNRTAKRADRAEAVAEALASDRDARAIEADGAADTLRRVEVVQREIRTAETILHHLSIQAEAAYDSDAYIDPNRLDRLRDADDRLCGVQPRLCTGATPPPRDAGDSGRAMSPARPG